MISWQAKLLKKLLKVQRWRQSDENANIERMRWEMDRVSERVPGRFPLQHESFMIGDMAAEWVWGENGRSDRIILYLHGGAYIFGSIASHRTLAGNIAQAAQARALLVDYRLAPEHPFPAALEDALAAYRWLLQQGFAPENIAIGGDSAGGGLTLATLVTLRDAGEPLPKTAVCLSPWTDLNGSGESLHTCAKTDPWLDPKMVIPTAQRYAADHDLCHPLISPLYADLHDLPPLLIQVGTAEILLSDAQRLAAKAAAAGVSVQLEEWEGMFHVWQAFGHHVPEGYSAIDNIGLFLRLRLGQPQAVPTGVVPAG